jgi:hypothetical protein
MVTGYKCRCGNKHIIEENVKEDRVKFKKSCHRCMKIKRLKKKANQRGKPKKYYLS